MTPLADADRQLLAFERQWYRYAGAKEQAIRDTFAMSPTRYWQRLNTLLAEPTALAEFPDVVRRLGRLRAGRQRARSARRLGLE